jgi:hypothetical protein
MEKGEAQERILHPSLFNFITMFSPFQNNTVVILRIDGIIAVSGFSQYR